MEAYVVLNHTHSKVFRSPQCVSCVVQAKGSALTGRSIGKPTAFGCTVFLVNVLGSFTYLFGGLFLATSFMRVSLLRTVTGI